MVDGASAGTIPVTGAGGNTFIPTGYTLQPYQSVGITGGSSSIVTGDFNGDGVSDILVAIANSPSLNLR